MIEAIESVKQFSASEKQLSIEPKDVELPVEPLQQPSQAEALDFAQRAANLQAREVPVVPSPSNSGLMDKIATQVDFLARHLTAPQLPDKAAGDLGLHNGASAKEEMSAALSQMEHAYMFAIETTLTSRGSTESTKIFNTLLKGQ